MKASATPKTCCSHSDDGYKHTLYILVIRVAVISPNSRVKKKTATLHNGDSCGVCPCLQRPQPRAGNGACPRAGLRRRASVQQPLLHRGGSLRDGVVSFIQKASLLCRFATFHHFACNISAFFFFFGYSSYLFRSKTTKSHVFANKQQCLTVGSWTTPSMVRKEKSATEASFISHLVKQNRRSFAL